ncbi:MAG: c-type cytochrome [Planctomycetes bacterium]|nr:c-type cytochrome [Planctomycetota bacterium]
MNPQNTKQMAALAIACLHILWGAILIGADPADNQYDPEPVVSLLELVIDADSDSARKCFAVLAEKTQTGEISGTKLDGLRSRLQETLNSILVTPNHALYVDVAILAATWKIDAGLSATRSFLSDAKRPARVRLASVRALIAARDPKLLVAVSRILRDPESRDAKFRGQILESLGRLDDPAVADVVLKRYESLEPELQAKAIELLTQRPDWSKRLLMAIGRDEIPATALNVNQVTRMQASRDKELQKLVRSQWGTVRTERNPDREKVVARMRELILNTEGDAFRGRLVFKKLCGQCHRIYGDGNDVGPDITGNGRSSFDQLLSNVFDPSLVIGADYQARTLITTNGRVLTGLVVEESDQRVVLKMQGAKVEAIATDDIEAMKTSKLSLMPEDLEKQLKPQELADLFEFLSLDKPPEDPKARYIPGSKP